MGGAFGVNVQITFNDEKKKKDDAAQEPRRSAVV
jgi:hypothetical protein